MDGRMCSAAVTMKQEYCLMQEDEIYDKQFGQAFAAQALDPNDRRNVLRDDYALEIAGVLRRRMPCPMGLCF
jgi:hypothetical protein